MAESLLQADALIAAPVLPMLRRPSRRSEQVSQGLMGERIDVLERRAGWCRIRTPDGYEGWCGGGGLAPVPTGWDAPIFEVQPLWANMRVAPNYRSCDRITLFAGSRLPFGGEEADWLGLRLPDGSVAWTERHRVRSWAGPALCPPAPLAVLRTAERFLGLPYLWGGCTPLGFDCSGFVQLVHRLHGWNLPRDARDQSGCGEEVRLDQLAAGDLLFFGPESGGADLVTHVALCLDGRRIIHAAGSDRVRVDDWRDDPYGPRALFGRRLT
jgi:hypothetical protein